MSQGVWGYWMIALGIGVITIMMFVQNYTTINQEDYYLLKEVTQASMYDAIDYNHYRQYGELKINREKFIENFERRFSESVKGNKNYKTDFYSIYETPPKVSVRVTTKTSSFEVSGNAMNLDVTNDIDAILENNSKSITKIFYSMPYYDCPKEKQDALGYCTVTNSATLNSTGINNAIIKQLNEIGKNVSADDIKIISSKYIGQITTNEDFDNYINQYNDTYGISYNQVNHRAPTYSDVGRPTNILAANELIDVKFTITNNNVIAWSGKFKCYGDHGYPINSKEQTTDGTVGNPINGQCLVGIKYELKFSY